MFNKENFDTFFVNKMSFLTDLPSHNPDSFTQHKRRFKNVQIKKSFGQGRNYIPPAEDSIPEPSQGMIRLSFF